MQRSRDQEQVGPSTAELLRELAEGAATLVRKEMELGRQELEETLASWFRAVAAIAVAAVLGTVTIGLLCFAAVTALSAYMPGWAAVLSIAGAAMVSSSAALVFALHRMRSQPILPHRTRQSIEEDVEWAKAQLKR
jgi:uncharacterized membrane protein YqjE